MQDIIALCKILSRQKIKDLQIFKENNKQLQLYQGVIAGTIKTEKDAVKNLYQGKVSKNNLQMLKYRLKHKLLNALFQIDLNQPRYSNYNRSRINVYKNWSFVNILLENNARPVAIEICEEAFRKATKFGFTDLQILLGRLLMKHYGFLDIDRKKHKYYESIIFEKLEVLKQELITEKYYSDISQEYVVKKSSDNDKLKLKLEKYTKELSEYEKQNKTYIICLYYYKILIAKHLLDKNYNKAKVIGIKGLEYFSKEDIRTPVAEFLFRQTIHICHIQLAEYDEAILKIKQNLEIATPYKFNWYKEWGYYFGWAVITKNYDEMVKATYTATHNKKLVQYPMLLETWRIKEAYVQMLIKLDMVSEKALELYPLRGFRINKFLNDVPKYSKDKRGLNVSILIAHFMHLLIAKKYDLLINKIENLRLYSYRYLRNDSTLRSNCFIKMISKIPDTNYHPQALTRHTKKLYTKLVGSKYSYTDNPTEIEVIPYENLWEIVLEILAKNQKKR